MGFRLKDASRRRSISEQNFAYLLLAPTFLLMTVLLLYPLLYSLYLSVVDIHILRPGTPPEFVGGKFYQSILTSQDFWRSLGRTVYFGALNLGFSMVLGLALALLLNNRFRCRSLVRSMAIIPWAVPGVVNGLLWIWIYNSNYGALNGLLIQLGLIDQGISWMTSIQRSMPLLVFADVWTIIPFVCLMYLSALQSIPSDLYEAGVVDGASSLQKFRHITWPMLYPMTRVLLVLRTIAVFKVFDIIYTLTKGGPASSTKVIGYYIYEQGFLFTKFGMASAGSYVLTAIILALVFFYFKLIRIEEYA